MNCTAFRDVVAAYADGDVTSAERGDIESHLIACVACRSLVEDTRVVREAIVLHRVVTPMPDGLWDRVRHAMDRHTGDSVRVRRFAFGAVSLLALAAFARIAVNNLSVASSPIPIAHAQTQMIPASAPVMWSENTSNTSQAFAMVRSKLGMEVAPVNLSMVGGKLQRATVYDSPRVGMLTYKLHGGLLRYYVSSKPFALEGAQKWLILDREVSAVSDATGLMAAWQEKDLNCAVVTDYADPEPKGLLAEFIRAVAPGR